MNGLKWNEGLFLLGFQRGFQPIGHAGFVEFPFAVVGPVLHSVRGSIQQNQVVAGTLSFQTLGIRQSAAVQLILGSLYQQNGRQVLMDVM
jgi:hypothetical protein